MSYYKSSYAVNDIFVDFSGNKYTVVVGGNTPTTPFNKDNVVNNRIVWGTIELVPKSDSGAGISNWVSGTSYNIGDNVIKDNILYQCITANSDSTWTPANWQKIGDNDFTGATSSADGEHGLVPEPSAGDENKALLGNGTWGEVGTSINDWVSGKSYNEKDLVIKDQILYQANTTTSITWVESEWNIIGTNFNTTSVYAQKIVTNVVAPYEMLLQVGDSNYCKPPIDVLKKTGGSDNVTLTLENYNNASAYTGTSDFLKIENSKAKLYNYKEYPITPQTLSTIDIGVSDEIDFSEFYNSISIDEYILVLLHLNNNTTDEIGNMWAENGTFSYTTGVFNNALDSPSSNRYLSINANSSIINFPSSDFTIDWWWKLPETGSIYSGGNTHSIIGGGNNAWIVHVSDSGLVVGIQYVSDDFTLPVTWSTYQDGNFHHFAIVKYNNAYTLYIDGTSISTYNSSTTYTTASTFYLFGNPSGSLTLGVMDEFRISNVARWTSDFTPPTQPYARPNYNISSLEVN